MKYWNGPLRVTALLLFVWNPCFGQESDSDREFWKAYSTAVQEFPFEKAPKHQSIYALLEIVKHVNEIDKPELSTALWQRAKRMLGDNAKIQYQQHLLQVALTFDELESATSIAKSAEGKWQKQWLDTVDLVKLKRGHKNALKDYPREPMDFFKALEHGNALVTAQRFEEADKFIQDLDIPHEENDPRGVGAMVYRKIAEYYQKKDDDKNARKYIDKAMAIGGNLYYTGFGVKAKKLAIYGELKGKQLRKMQNLGKAYGGHMRRELLSRLVNELVLLNKFDDAQKTVTYFEKSKESDRKLKDIAIAQAAGGNSLGAEKTINRIDSKETRSAARLGMARQLFLIGEAGKAEEILKQEIKSISSFAKPPESVFREVGNTLGVMNQSETFIKLLDGHPDPASRAMFLWEGIRGHAEKIKRKKSSQPD